MALYNEVSVVMHAYVCICILLRECMC